ncbi:hypothetical protein ACFST9_12635 [Hymenobacter monticola]|uniref:Uncharacterized protein n=1 Tax=Hymenobacter monticola TaxID=1705399 RepID=A0ABY4BFE9_9BACT|nr:hypothetical protein [Hymenobacter monticola]UOE36466.1 hypothetical protein MTP16_23550 [Hymenobacter monticola]
MSPIVAHPTVEEQLLADAILRHRPLALAPALQAALRVAGEYVPEEEAVLLQAYADAIAIDMVPDGYRYVRRDGLPLLGLGPLELFTEPGNPQLLTRCAVWYGAEARAEWYRRGGT